MTAETKSISKLSSSLSEYLDDKQLEQVKKAFFYASNAHSGQFRSSGDPYVSHPIAVAKILADFNLPYILQPIHLLLAMISFGCMSRLLFNYKISNN